MKGLLLKDLYLLRKNMRSYLIIIAVFIGVSIFAGDNQFMAFYPCILVCMIPVSLLSFDERSGWERYSAALPYSRAQIVSAKFLIGLMVQVTVMALVVAAQSLRLHFSGELHPAALISMAEMLTTLSLLSSALPLVFMFRYGVEKGRMAYLVAIVLAASGSALLSGLFEQMLHANRFLMNAQLAVCLGAVVCYILLWMLSIRLYQKREF